MGVVVKDITIGAEGLGFDLLADQNQTHLSKRGKIFSWSVLTNQCVITGSIVLSHLTHVHEKNHEAINIAGNTFSCQDVCVSSFR